MRFFVVFPILPTTSHLSFAWIASLSATHMCILARLESFYFICMFVIDRINRLSHRCIIELLSKRPKDYKIHIHKHIHTLMHAFYYFGSLNGWQMLLQHQQFTSNFFLFDCRCRAHSTFNKIKREWRRRRRRETIETEMHEAKMLEKDVKYGIGMLQSPRICAYRLYDYRTMCAVCARYNSIWTLHCHSRVYTCMQSCHCGHSYSFDLTRFDSIQLSSAPNYFIFNFSLSFWFRYREANTRSLFVRTAVFCLFSSHNLLASVRWFLCELYAFSSSSRVCFFLIRRCYRFPFQ